MEWKKQGFIFCADSNFKWMQTHASLPFADHLVDDNYRIFFSSRDLQNHAQIGFVDIDITQPQKILQISKNPILSVGDLGSFDEHGVMGSSLVNYDGKKYLYYIGWNVNQSIPFRWSIGLAISKDGGNTFEKFSKGPILDRNTVDPFMVSSPTVIYDDNLWRMYYISPIKCYYENNIFKAPYNIKYAESDDGINWRRDGIVAIDFKYPNEFAIGRASIIKEHGLFRMWYSYSIDQYRIGYAESDDGIKWERKDDLVGITVSNSGWDSESVEHCHVFNHLKSKYMLYTGNNYGKTGFGLAKLDSN